MNPFQTRKGGNGVHMLRRAVQRRKQSRRIGPPQEAFPMPPGQEPYPLPQIQPDPQGDDMLNLIRRIHGGGQGGDIQPARGWGTLELQGGGGGPHGMDYGQGMNDEGEDGFQPHPMAPPRGNPMFGAPMRQLLAQLRRRAPVRPPTSRRFRPF